MRFRRTLLPPVMAGVMLSLSAAPILNAQDLLLNVPYACRNGITLTVQRCEPGGDGEVCTYERKLATGRVSFPSVKRTTLINLLRPCQRAQGQASAPAAPTARPQAAQQPPAAPARTQATNPPYLGQFPSVERVRSEIEGADAMETAARQMGAFWQLQEIIKEMSGLRWTTNGLTADEKRLLGQYAVAYQLAGQPYASTPDRARWYQMHALYETSQSFRDDLFGKLLSPALRDQWAQTKGDTRARVDASKQAQEADFQRFRAGIARDAPMSQREWAHCLAGYSESYCLKRMDERAMFKGGLETLGGMFALTEDRTETASTRPGLALAGAYSGQGGLMIAFGAAATASVHCAGVIAPAGYRVERQGNQVQVRLTARQATGIRADKALAAQYDASVSRTDDPEQWQGQRVILSLRADGTLAGTGPLKVTGPVAAGSLHGTKTTTVYTGTGQVTREEPVTQVVYEDRSVPCTFGILRPTGKVSAVEKGTSGPDLLSGVQGIRALTARVTDPLLSGARTVDELKNPVAKSDPDPGLRMQGRYSAEGGLDIEFLHNAAVVGCKQAAFPRDYTVSLSANRVLVSIQNPAGPMVLELRPDGKLFGSGTVELEGRVLAGLDVNNHPVFQQASETCSLGVFDPSPQAQ
jgi:hypothetical protein